MTDNALIDQPATPTAHTRSPGEFSKLLSATRTNRRWIVTACVMLGLSGAVRYWRDLQFLSIHNQSKDSPFPLKDIPKDLGTWRAVEGSEAVLDPEIAKVAGSTDHMIRTYANDKGTQITVLVLYGPADAVWGHTPDICYPASGFGTLVAPRNVQVPLGDSSRSVTFREGVYGRPQAEGNEFHEVYYSFLNAGEWRPNMDDRWKRFRYFPGMFKIQIERRVKAVGLEDSPSPGLLANLVKEIETRSRTAEAGSPATVATTAADPAGK
jgi:EpsI family protein